MANNEGNRLVFAEIMREMAEKSADRLSRQNDELRGKIAQLEAQVISLQQENSRASSKPVPPVSGPRLFDTTTREKDDREAFEKMAQVSKDAADTWKQAQQSIAERKKLSQKYEEFLRRYPGAYKISFDDWHAGRYNLLTFPAF